MILLALTEKPVSGYDLKKAFDETLQHFWAADMAQIYRTLQRLENEKKLRSKEAAPERGPARRMYQRTAAGKRQLDRWLSREPKFGPNRFNDVAQLVFMHELNDLTATLQFLEQMKQKLQRRLKILEVIASAEPSTDCATMPLADLHGWLGLKMGLGSVAEKIRWCEESISIVKNRLKQEA